MEKLLFGVAYYYEYLPTDRLHEDIKMMKDANINVVRIAESTWSTYEKEPGKYDFTAVEKVLDAMEEAGISVIIGTPTYAIPSWLEKLDPSVMVVQNGQDRALYGQRQQMDITNKTYLYYAEKIIRKLLEVSAYRKNVIGFQVDNETKAYGTSDCSVQKRFVKYLKEKFNDDLDKMNYAFGLDYWSNRIDSWEDFPNVSGTINGSLASEFEKFQRYLVEEFLEWQVNLVNEYRRDDQFVTQNFDFEWRGYSYGVQPEVNHFRASQPLTVAGCDIYHPSQNDLTGLEIAFGGDSTRLLKNNNYLVLETQAQGFPRWTPLKNQLLLQAYSHLASGANLLMYWHWHSIHNSKETYWKGLLGHDFRENDTYLQAKQIGKEFKQLSSKLVNLKKKNSVALVVSNESLTALKYFPIDIDAMFTGNITYNDIIKLYYQSLYELNIEVDIVTPEHPNWTDYEVLIVPALYSASEKTLLELKKYVELGGKLISGIRTGVADENIKVYHEGSPYILEEVFGMYYNQFTVPSEQLLESNEIFGELTPKVTGFMEYLIPKNGKTLVTYGNSQTTINSALVSNHFYDGNAVYIGFLAEVSTMKKIIKYIFEQIFNRELINCEFPLILRKGINDEGNTITYVLNYSKEKQHLKLGIEANSLRDNLIVRKNDQIVMEPWDVKILES
ncbi:beta-galactosidase [Aerococcaceae bacterium zg-ZJ1578]|uniref:beta-galactosidase n=1 Tax=Aerococcaceae bacterium zg-252 TaxID=2796928 RepID=UPI001A290460|nr:beta-galactosidase [Aerococcaceae bacterium zg-1578]MBR7927538.1 beta-galactosidase [Aerococcaceae bacterium zg-ZUI334]